MNFHVTTTIVLLIALICHVIADRPSRECPIPQSLCVQNLSTPGPPSELIGPAIGADPPPPPMPFFPPPPPPPVFDNDEDWKKAVCRGTNLLKAMVLDEAETFQFLQWPYTESSWDGDLREALGKWGYSQEEYADKACDFKEKYHFGTALQALGIDAKPADQGGSNHCYFLQHNDGPSVRPGPDGHRLPIGEQKYIVDGKEYPATGAYARFGVNAKDGIVYFIHRKSPESTDSQRSKDELPKIRSSSDLAWGMWNRAAVPNHDIKNIKYFVAVNIINPATAYNIIPKALRLRGEHNGAKPWPGTSFQPFKKEGDNKDEEEAALALIGSPNGLAAGYFLLQHKRQLGIKNIWNVVVFRDDSQSSNDVNLMFYVDPNPSPKKEVPEVPNDDTKNQANAAQNHFESTVGDRSVDGKSLLREYIFRAKL